ncbi:MAG: hypothetical protein WBA74_07435 [Cyclobacteriaceae bacterium]
MKKRLMIIGTLLILSIGYSCNDAYDEITTPQIEEAEYSGADDADEDDDLPPVPVPCGCTTVG